MKCIVWMIVLSVCCMTAAGYAEDTAAESPTVVVDDSISDAPVQEIKGIALITAGEIDASLVERVQSYVQQNLFTTVTLLAPIELVEGGFDALASAAAEKKTDNQLCVIVLATMEGNEHHGASYPEINTAVINASALRPEEDDAEKYGRRLEKQIMSAAGLLLGMKVCPNPHCALCSYATMERLDTKGRNYCPPCQSRIQKILKEKGALLETSPLYPPTQ